MKNLHKALAIRFIQPPAPGPHFLLMFIAFLHFLNLMEVDLVCAFVITDVVKQARSVKETILFLNLRYSPKYI